MLSKTRLSPKYLRSQADRLNNWYVRRRQGPMLQRKVAIAYLTRRTEKLQIMDIRKKSNSGPYHLLLWTGNTRSTDNAAEDAGRQFSEGVFFILSQTVQGPDPG